MAETLEIRIDASPALKQLQAIADEIKKLGNEANDLGKSTGGVDALNKKLQEMRGPSPIAVDSTRKLTDAIQSLGRTELGNLNSRLRELTGIDFSRVTNTIAPFMDKLRGAGSALKDFWKSDSGSLNLSKVISDIGGALSSVWDSAKRAASGAVDFFRSGSGASGMRSLVADIGEAFGMVGQSVLNAGGYVGRFFSGLNEGAKVAVAGLIRVLPALFGIGAALAGISFVAILASVSMFTDAIGVAGGKFVDAFSRQMAPAAQHLADALNKSGLIEGVTSLGDAAGRIGAKFIESFIIPAIEGLVKLNAKVEEHRRIMAGLPPETQKAATAQKALNSEYDTAEKRSRAFTDANKMLEGTLGRTGAISSRLGAELRTSGNAMRETGESAVAMGANVNRAGEVAESAFIDMNVELEKAKDRWRDMVDFSDAQRLGESLEQVSASTQKFGEVTKGATDALGLERTAIVESMNSVQALIEANGRELEAARAAYDIRGLSVTRYNEESAARSELSGEMARTIELLAQQTPAQQMHVEALERERMGLLATRDAMGQRKDAIAAQKEGLTGLAQTERETAAATEAFRQSLGQPLTSGFADALGELNQDFAVFRAQTAGAVEGADALNAALKAGDKSADGFGDGLDSAGDDAKLLGKDTDLARESTDRIQGEMESAASDAMALASSYSAAASAARELAAAQNSVGDGSGGIDIGSSRQGGIAGQAIESERVRSSVINGAPHFSEGVANTSRYPSTLPGGGLLSVLHPSEAVVPLSKGRSIPVDLNLSGMNGPQIPDMIELGGIDQLSQAMFALTAAVDRAGVGGGATMSPISPDYVSPIRSPGLSGKADSGERAGSTNTNVYAPVKMTVYATDADSFKRSADQIALKAKAAQDRAARRNS